MKKIFKSTNKVLLTALLTGLLSSAGSAKLVARTFYSADKSKSFKATLTAFDEEKKQVKVRTAKGKDITFKLSVLSEECKAYVAEHASEVAVATALSISFEKVKEKKVKGVDGVNTTFDVTFYNKSETTLKDVVIDYTIYWKKGNITKGQKSTQMEEKGSFSVYDLDPKYRVTETTKAVNVVNKTIKSEGGGWCGPATPGGRLSDQVQGIVIDVKVNGEIVMSDSNNRSLLAKVLRERGE